jgi:hypothetical protein
MTLNVKLQDLHSFERLVSKLVKTSDDPLICFTPQDGNLKLSAFTKDATLSVLINTVGFAHSFSMRWSDFKSLATAKKNTDIVFDLQKDAVQVRCGEVLHRFLTGKKISNLPSRPTQTATHSKGRLLDALVNAARCVDKDSITPARTGICLRGATSQVISTTGAQLLVQNGYDFAWDNCDVIVPPSKLFTSKEVRAIDGDDALVGLVAGLFYFAIGSVEVWLRPVEGVFPKVERHLVPADGAAYLTIHPTDVQFLIDKMGKLPDVKVDDNAPVYLALDKTVQVRAHDATNKTAIALELSRSTFTGEPVSVSLNRQFLRNAVEFGCWKIGIDPAGDTPIIATGDDKTFVAMPLTGTEPEGASVEVITSTSAQPASVPKGTAVPTPTPTPEPVKRRRRVSAKRDTVKPTGKEALLQSVLQLRQDLRTSLVRTNDLLKEVRMQKQQDRLLKSSLDTLRKLSLA